MTETEFNQLAIQGYNRIALVAEAFADLETPLSLYLKLAHVQNGGQYSFLLESVVGGERFGRYSFIGLPASTLLRASGFGAQAKTEVVMNGQVVETHHGNPLDFVSDYQKRFKVALREGMPRFCGGLAGYFGYDTVRHIEKNSRTPARQMIWVCPIFCCCSVKNWPSSTTSPASCRSWSTPILRNRRHMPKRKRAWTNSSCV